MAQMAGPDPALYASTGSWAGQPYDMPSYGPPGGYAPYAAPYAAAPAEYGPPSGYALSGPPSGAYSSFRQTGLPRYLSSTPYQGPPPVDLYRNGGFRGYGMPPTPQYEDPYGYRPMPQPRQKVYGVGILFSEQTDQMGRPVVVVKDVYQGTPAASLGRPKPGDVLKSVQGKPVDGKSIRELRALVPGPLGSSVNIGFEGEQGPFDVDLERVQSGRGQPTVYGGGGKGPAQRQAPPRPASTEGKAYVGFSVQQSGDPRDPDYTVANVTAESTADQQGLTQGDKIQAIDNKDIRGMHEEEVKQMLIGEPFSTVKIVTTSRTVEIERDCAVPEPENGGPMVGGANMYASYGGYQSMAMPMPPQAGYYPPRGYPVYAPPSYGPPMTYAPSYSPPMTYAAPAYSPPVTYAQAPVYTSGAPLATPAAPVYTSGAPLATPSYSYAAPATAYGPGPGYGADYGADYGAPQYAPGPAYGAALPQSASGYGPRYR